MGQTPILLDQRIGMRRILVLSFPIMLSMLSFTAMSVVDTIYISQLGTAPLAGVGLAITMVFLVHSFGNGLLSGLKIIISQYVGAGDDTRARRLGWHGLWLAAIGGLLVAATGPLGTWSFPLMGASVEVAAEANAFFQIRVLGAPLIFAMTAMSSYFHGQGDMRTPMIATLLANGVNIIVDPILIFGLGPILAYGVEGGALATILGFATGAAYLWMRIRNTLFDAPRRFCFELLRDIWTVGMPIGVRYLLEVGSYLVFAAMLAQLGDFELAAHIIVVRIISVSFLPGYAIGEAASILVGQAIGAGRLHVTRVAWRYATCVALIIMAFCGLLFWLIPDVLFAVFSPDPQVLTIGYQLLLIAAAFQIFDAIAMVTICTLNGAGDTRFTMWLGVLATWCIKLPIGYLCAIPLCYGAAGAWFGLTMEIVVVAALGYWRYCGTAWLEHSVSVGPVQDTEQEPLVFQESVTSSAEQEVTAVSEVVQ